MTNHESPAIADVLTVQQSINQEIEKFDPYTARLEEIKIKYADIQIANENDAEGYEDARLAIAELRAIRTGTAKDKAIIKAPFLLACNQIEEKSKWIIAEVSKIENPIQSRKDEIDEIRERIKIEKKRKQDETFIIRQQELTKMGALYSDGLFILEDVQIEATLIREADEEIWQKSILNPFKAVFDRNEATRHEQERKDQEIKEYIEKERLEHDRLTEEIRQMEEKKKDHAFFLRSQALTEIGFKISSHFFVCNDLIITSKDVREMNEETFISKLSEYAKLISEANEEKLKKEKQEKERQILLKKLKDREDLITALGFTVRPEYIIGYNTRYPFSNISENDEFFFNEWVNELKQVREQWTIEEDKRRADIAIQEIRAAEELKKQNELDELAKASDKEKWHHFINELKKVTLPTFNSGLYKNLSNAALSKINEICYLNSKK